MSDERHEDYALDWTARRRRRLYRLHFQFKREDAWVGAFWRSSYTGDRRDPERRQSINATEVWVCLLPCVPLHIVIAHEPALAHSAESRAE